MQRSDIARDVVDILRRFLPEPSAGEVIGEHQAIIADLGISSVRVIDIVIDLEQHFGVGVEDERIEQLVTVGDIVGYIAERLSVEGRT